MNDDRPTWARRMAPGWTRAVAVAVAAMLLHAEKQLPDDSSLGLRLDSG